MTNDLATFMDGQTARLERLMPGPIERVWDYLTKSEYLRTWLAVGDIEERVGAQVELTQDSDDVPYRVDHLFQGEVTQCDPPRLLAWTWDDRVGPPSEVRFELEPRGDQVLLTLTHERLAPEDMPEVGAGWHTHIGIMIAHIKGEQPEPFMETFEPLVAIYREQLAAVRS